jgi:predicted GIY-YIG superfamily endonuclease
VPVRLLKEREMGLWGAAWLATGQAPQPEFRIKTIEPRQKLPYLEEKYQQWRAWLTEVLQQNQS